jgi:hypothetical protein
MLGCFLALEGLSIVVARCASPRSEDALPSAVVTNAVLPDAVHIFYRKTDQR